MDAFIFDFGVLVGIAAPFAILFALAAATFKIALSKAVRRWLVGYCVLAIMLLYKGATQNPYARLEHDTRYMGAMTLIVGLIVAAVLYYPRRDKLPVA
ncbi:hypothetical protein ACFSHT_09005 [Paraburkholderia silviterrae]|uniref:Uncharacterized protein n=1 Tax=Paraburkholderia silviterrae TaxID=2528715 RepID=A0A4V2ZZG0_9BURK|nr:hypothetical protein [Paraburkholderia silviterrae]TDG25131.1 hypothetical protein EYW47_04515 [Paraburkholderia silviterrae]